ncbi:MAG: insulinase family protein [Thermoplasmata archaeon]|nr:insulinase family protein [Thermoplasmata archaeon]
MPGVESPLLLDSVTWDGGIELIRQSPPVGAASFSITFLAPAGWGQEPAAQGGRSRLLSALLTSGAGRWNRAELARRLDALGATLHSDVSPENLSVTLWGPEAHRDRLIPLLTESILHPRFEPLELARVRRELTERQMRELRQPASRAEKELFHRIFSRGHPLRETGFGSPASLARVDRAALRRELATRVHSRGSRFIATTRLSAEEVSRRLSRALGDVLEADLPPPPEIPPRARGSETPQRVELPGNSQSEIRLGGPSLVRSDPEYPAAYLANEVLGGRSLLSRLFQRIRERRGLAYHTGSELASGLWDGCWVVEAGTAPAQSGRVLSLLHREIRQLGKGTLGRAELHRIRESALGSIELELEDTASAHGLAVEVAESALPLQHWTDWPAQLRAVSPAAVSSASLRALDLEFASSVIAGPK